MKLLTSEIRNQLPALYSQEQTLDPLVVVKFFTPWTNWTWYGIEFDGEDTFFGLVKGFEEELGYFSLSELESFTGPAGLTIERDLYFSPTLLSEINPKFVRTTMSAAEEFQALFGDGLDGMAADAEEFES